MTAIISPEGRHLVPPLTEGEGVLLADLDLSLIVKRKRMMDSVGHYARPELISAQLDQRPARPLHLAPQGAFEPAHSTEGDGHEPADRTPKRVAEFRRSAG
jgi:aliphatic nitrilase